MRPDLAGAGVGVVILDVPLHEAALETTVKGFLARVDASCAVFAVIEVASIASARALLRLGVSEVFEAGEAGSAGLLEAIERKVGHRPRRQAVVHAVMGLKGGCGATTVALELAFRSARQLGEPAIRLVDLDFGFGRTADRLGVKAYWPPGGADGVLTSDAGSSFATRHWSGLEVCAAPFLASPCPSLGEVMQTVGFLREDAELVVLDTPRSDHGLREFALTTSDIVTLVSDTTPSGLELARRTLTALDEMLAGSKEIFVVFNRRARRGEGATFDAVAIRKAINYDQLVVLDEDRESFGRAVLLREPVHYAAPESPFVRGFGAYVDLLKVGRRWVTSSQRAATRN